MWCEGMFDLDHRQEVGSESPDAAGTPPQPVISVLTPTSVSWTVITKQT